MNILLYIHDADFSLDQIIYPYLKKKTSVYTIGKQDTDFLIRNNDLDKQQLAQFIKKNNITHFVYCENNTYLPPILDILPEKVITVMFLTDTNTGVRKRIPYVKMFDVILLICRQHTQELRKYNPHVYGFFYGVDTQKFYKMPKVQKKYDVVFVGNIIPWVHYERFFLLQYLKWKGIHIRHLTVPYERVNELLNKAKISLNKTPLKGFNMRIFESLGSGSLLLNDYCVENGMTKILKDAKHLIYYRNFEDAYNKITYYLDHEQEREHIAKNGHDYAVKNYAWDKRIEEMCDLLESNSINHRNIDTCYDFEMSKLQAYIFRNQDQAIRFLNRALTKGDISRFTYYSYKMQYICYLSFSSIILHIIKRLKNML